MNKRSAFAIVVGCFAVAAPLGAAAVTHWPGTRVGEQTAPARGVPAALARNLARFDDLDYRVYSGQKWEDLHQSHATDIVVHYPDGHVTKGLEAHIAELKPLFTFAPDAKITEHPVRFGTADAEWTAVAGAIDGTFTKAMQLPDGQVVPPTGKRFHLPMATLGHWRNGVMFEEFLYWDNASLTKQIGLGQ